MSEGWWRILANVGTAVCSTAPVPVDECPSAPTRLFGSTESLYKQEITFAGKQFYLSLFLPNLSDSANLSEHHVISDLSVRSHLTR